MLRFVWGLWDSFFCDLFWDLGICFFSSRFVWGFGDFCTISLGIFVAICLGSWGSFFRDSSGDLGLCFFAIRLGIRGL